MSIQEIWEWKSAPFARGSDGSVFYESHAQREALARIELVIEGHGFGLVTGEVGSGKSTFVRRIVRELDDMQYFAMYICKADLKPRDFYGEILTQLGESVPFSVAKARKVWEERALSQAGRPDRQWVVVVDEAQEMSDDMLQELRFLRNQAMDAQSVFALILTGQPELRRRLRLKKYEAIAQRLDMVYHLHGLTQDETTAYIRQQMQQTGATLPVFSDQAIRAIYRASQGLPRLVNHLCTQSLYAAAPQKSEVIDEGHVQSVLADQEQQRGTAG